MVDPNIKKKADDIRNKVYGREVRESLASGLEEISSDVVENESRQSVVEGRQDSVESQWQNVVDETTNLDVVSAPEIIAARDGEANLKARLDKDHQEVATQLAQTIKTMERDSEQRGINAVNQFNIPQDKQDVTELVQSVYDYASALKLDVWWANGDYLISKPINTKGCSTFGQNPFKVTFYANPDTPISEWQAGDNVNDVGLFYSKNENGVTVERIGVDGQGAYVAGMTFLGGHKVSARFNYVRNCANCGIQFYGRNKSKNDPGNTEDKQVKDGIMSENIVDFCRWNLVFDGEVHASQMTNNISLNATNRHLSLDPREASERNARGNTVSDNSCIGFGEMPVSWEGHPSRNDRDYAIYTTTSNHVVITGNFVHNWDKYGMGIIDSSVTFLNNRIQVDAGLPKMEIGINLVNATGGTTINSNSIVNAEVGIKNDSLSRKTMVALNNINNCDIPIDRHENTRQDFI